MINGLIHKNYSISVQGIPDRFDRFDAASFAPEVDIGATEGKPIMKLINTQPFATESEAEAYGFEMGKNWIDKYIAALNESEGSYTRNNSEQQPPSDSLASC